MCAHMCAQVYAGACVHTCVTCECDRIERLGGELSGLRWLSGCFKEMEASQLSLQSLP